MALQKDDEEATLEDVVVLEEEEEDFNNKASNFAPAKLVETAIASLQSIRDDALLFQNPKFSQLGILIVLGVELKLPQLGFSFCFFFFFWRKQKLCGTKILTHYLWSESLMGAFGLKLFFFFFFGVLEEMEMGFVISLASDWRVDRTFYPHSLFASIFLSHFTGPTIVQYQ